MKTIKKMTLLAIMAFLCTAGFMLGGCQASVGVDSAHSSHHTHGDGCGHHWDGSHWR